MEDNWGTEKISQTPMIEGSISKYNDLGAHFKYGRFKVYIKKTLKNMDHEITNKKDCIEI